MSNDPFINSAILNFCAKAGGDGTGAAAAAAASAPPVDRPARDYDWLREAMAAVESPERKLKKMLSFVLEYDADVFGSAAKATTTTTTTTGTNASGAPQQPAAAPLMLLGGAPQAAAASSTQPEQQQPSAPPPQQQQQQQQAPAAQKPATEQPTFASVEERNEYLLETLEELSDMVEDINWATEYGLMAGPRITLHFLEGIVAHEEAAVRTAAANPSAADAGEGEEEVAATAPRTLLAAFTEDILSEVKTTLCMVIAHAAQLNEKMQAEFLQLQWPALLLRAVRVEVAKGDAQGTPSPAAVAAALHACSCLCRDSPPNTIAFIQAGGVDMLIAALRRREGGRAPPHLNSKILARIFFFAAYLAENGLSAEELIDLLCQYTEVRDDGGSSSTECTSADGALVARTTTATATAEAAEHPSASSSPAFVLSEAAEMAAAQALLALAEKSTSVVKQKARSLMPRRLREWAALNDAEDPRRQVADAVSKAG